MCTNNVSASLMDAKHQILHSLVASKLNLRKNAENAAKMRICKRVDTGRGRTFDLPLRRRMLYPLSYSAVVFEHTRLS